MKETHKSELVNKLVETAKMVSIDDIRINRVFNELYTFWYHNPEVFDSFENEMFTDYNIIVLDDADDIVCFDSQLDKVEDIISQLVEYYN